MLQKFECFGVAGVLDVWASTKIDEFTDSVNTGHLAGRYLRLNQLSFVLIVREDIKSLLSGAVESFELVLCFYYLLDIGLYTLVI